MSRMMFDKFLYVVTIFHSRARSLRGQRVMREAVSTIHQMRKPHARGDEPNDTEQLSLNSTADMLLEMHSMDVIIRVRRIPYLHSQPHLWQGKHLSCVELRTQIGIYC
jgi:hypothetical protein